MGEWGSRPAYTRTTGGLGPELANRGVRLFMVPVSRVSGD